MKKDETAPIPEQAPDDAADEKTGLSGRVTWRSVYLLVVVVTIVYIALLVALEKGYS